MKIKRAYEMSVRFLPRALVALVLQPENNSGALQYKSQMVEKVDDLRR